MGTLVFEARSAANPTGTPLGVLTDAREKQLLVEDDGVGSGSFVISRHSSQAAWCDRGNYIAAYIDTATGNLANAIGGFWIESGGDDLISTAEEGGEDLARAGRGPIAVLSEAVVMDSTRVGNRSAAQPARRRWHWDDVHPGAVLRRQILEAKAWGTLPFVTFDFTRRRDSDGNLWKEAEAQRMNIPMGINHLELVDILRDTGLYVRMTPGFLLQAWDSYGNDLSASVTFTKGVNIRETAQRQMAAARARCRILVEGEKRQGQGRFRVVHDPDIHSQLGLGRHRTGFYRVERTTTRRVLRRIGRKRLRRWKKEWDEPIAFGVLDTPGQVALVDYSVGDTVTVDIPGEYDEEELRIVGITLVETEAGEYDPVLEFGTFHSGTANP